MKVYEEWGGSGKYSQFLASALDGTGRSPSGFFEPDTNKIEGSVGSRASPNVVTLIDHLGVKSRSSSQKKSHY
jgi:hypothetical protein